MKKATLLTLVLLFATMNAFPQDVNGDFSMMNGIKVYRVWGDHYERGYAQGYLMSDEVLAGFDGMMLDFFYTYFARDYEQARQFYINNFTVEEKYTQEAMGIIDGIQASGGSLLSENLEREIDYIDILAYAATADLVIAPPGSGSPAGGNNFCSTLSSWGTATLGDPELNGGMVVLRNLDLPLGNDYSHEMYNLTIHYPEEEGELKWVQLSFVPGFISSPSAINEKGFAIFSNQANIFSNSNLNDLYPTQLSLRNCIEIEDGNSDGDYDLNDFVWQRDQHTYLYGSISTCVTPDSAIILEQNNSGGTQRTVSDNSVISENNLVATNHFRELFPSIACSRYSNITDSLNTNSNISIERSWDLMKGAAGNATSIQTIQFIPSTRTIKYSHVREDGGPSHLNDPAVFNLDYLLSQTPIAIAVMTTIVEDTLIASSLLSNPLANQVEVWARIINAENQVIDSTLMFDDGLHGDGEAGDYLFAAPITLHLPDGEYVLESQTYNLDSNYVHIAQASFTYESTVSVDEGQIPNQYGLEQNYPNPFNPSTTIRYGLPEASNVSLVVYDLRGNRVKTMESEHQSAGWYTVTWNGETTDGKTISTGIYFARLVAGQYSQVIKMLYLN